MSNQELIDRLSRAMRTEGALAVQVRNIVSTLPWSGLPEAMRQQAIQSLATLGDGPERRARRIKALLDRLQGGEHGVL